MWNRVEASITEADMAAFKTAVNDLIAKLPRFALTATTDAAGKYGFTQSIPAGATPLRVSASGFIDAELTVTIVDGTLVEQDVSLAVA